MRSSVIGSPPTSGSAPSMMLTSATSATNTISMAIMLSSSAMPTVAPLAMASMVLSATGSSISSEFVRVSLSSGTMIWPIITAIGAPSTEAITRWPAASGMVEPRNCAYSTSTVPAMPAMPPVITTNSSLRDSLREIRPDEQRRFDMADEDVGGGREPDRAADAHRAVEREGEALDDRRQDAPVEQQGRQHAHQQHDRQRVERQHEVLAGEFQLERQCAAADIAEHEGGAGAARRGDGVDRGVQRGEGARDRRHLQKQRGQHDRDDEADQHALAATPRGGSR